MQLEGSCHCGKVKFQLDSEHPYPFNLCYCSICRKTAGGGGYAINLGGNFSTLQVTGEAHTTVYQATVTDPETGAATESPARRHFCRICGSALWAWDPRWPELVHPFASVIDTPLPEAPEQIHIMLGSKPAWVRLDAAEGEACFETYPEESLEAWHRRHGLLSDP